MKTILTFFAFFISVIAFAQNSKPYNEKQNIAVVTDREAQFPGGDNSLTNYVFTHISYSDDLKKKYLEGTVSLSFDVLPDSTVSNCIILSGVGNGIDEQVRNLVKAKKFAPAIMNKTKIKSNIIMDFPIRAY
jgi:TonB family protein